jgi:predicted nucleic acid-binding Zn finger protein
MSLPPHEIEMLEKNELTQSDIEHFTDKYGKRFVRALKVVEKKRVFKYHFLPSETTTWIVRGQRREYLVVPETYCTCRSFYQDVVISRESTMCYHLLAQKIAETRGHYQDVDSTDQDRRKLYVEWRRTD